MRGFLAGQQRLNTVATFKGLMNEIFKSRELFPVEVLC